MSLDVYLVLKNTECSGSGVSISSGIFVREDGQTREISRTEWDENFPDREPVVARTLKDDNTVYSANITHNLNKMASEAGIYKHLWRPDEINITKASQLVTPLKMGLAVLETDPERFKEFNPSNGWGTYEGLVEFTRNYLGACEQYPEAQVSVWR